MEVKRIDHFTGEIRKLSASRKDFWLAPSPK